ncbi:TIM-barrel domain-containing protein [Thalassomonas haliotis]|uniref:DUF5110 domain-containing protein n=1 Tax=Thalassomonas haliotis TaxID=485448 RepID=A0ABY7VC01_9GAMM|nr:TIM-barrel domain-containing protein [Thalassomonas haliotis]WDE11114.1 DUF5110 domain-containing protein [Thalassomonas haliotis]
MKKNIDNRGKSDAFYLPLSDDEHSRTQTRFSRRELDNQTATGEEIADHGCDIKLGEHDLLDVCPGVQDYYRQGNQVVLLTSRGEVSLEFTGRGNVYVHYRLNGLKQLPGYLLAENNHGTHVEADKEILLSQGDGELIFSCKETAVVVKKSPFRLLFVYQGQLLLEEELGYFEHDFFASQHLECKQPESSFEESNRRQGKTGIALASRRAQERQKQPGFRFKLQQQEKLFAGGQRVLGMDRRGFKLPLYNQTHFGYEDRVEQMNFGLPGLMSSGIYILMFDNTARGELDLGASEQDVLQFSACGGRSAYLVSMADSFPALIESYTQATGRQPLPPIWAFGNIASRFGYRSEAQAREVVAQYRHQQMPLDAIIFDLFWFGPDVQGHMGNLDWDRDNFATGEQMVADFTELGIKTILISEPFILTSSNNWHSGAGANAFVRDNADQPVTFDFFFGNGSLVDVFSEPGQSWFWPFYQKQLDWGIAGFWGDLGEPEAHPAHARHLIGSSGESAGGDEVHNVYGHQWAKLLYQGFCQSRPDQRPFIMMRSGFAGSQRYGMLPWTGDVGRTWGSLKAQVELSLQMGLLGLAYTHSDLGGFIETDHFDSELYLRWLQFGAFQPIFRPHAHDSVVPEPIFHGEQVAEGIREVLRWRYRLLPYNYSLAYENHSRGMPFMRPAFFACDSAANPGADAAVAAADVCGARLLDTRAYLWGPSLLIFPVTAPGVRELDYCLPEGNWFDYFSDRCYSGSGDRVTIPVNEQQIPVLVKGGAIIPHAPDMQNIREYSGDKLFIHYWFDAQVSESGFELYQDDGLSRGYQQGEFKLLSFSARLSEAAVLFQVQLSAGVRLQQAKALVLVVHNADAIRGVYRGEKRLTPHYQASTGQLTVELDFDGATQLLRLTF